MQKTALLIAILLLAPLALAQELTIIQPANGGSVDPARDRLVFSTTSDEVIESCTLYVDGATDRTTTYGEIIKGRSLSYAATLQDGTHTWSIACRTAAGDIITTENRTVTVGASADSIVKVIPSGVFRGSMMHTFTFANTAAQAPVFIPKVAAGDYVTITMNVPPSTITKELYVRSKLVKDGVPYLRLTYENKDYFVTLGENTSIDFGAAHILLGFVSVDGTRANLEAYPGISVPEETPTEEPEQPAAEPEQPVAEPEQPEPAEQPPVQESEQPAQEPVQPEKTPEPAEPSQPFFSRVLSWLVGIFGK